MRGSLHYLDKVLGPAMAQWFVGEQRSSPERRVKKFWAE